MRNFRRQQSNSTKAILVAITAIVSAFVIVIPGMREPLVNTFSGIVSQRSYALGVGSSIEEFSRSRQDLLARIEELEKQNRRLQQKGIAAEVVRKQNSSLKELLGRNGEYPSSTDNRLVARVQSRPPVSPYDSLIIDLGEQDGIERGMKVLGSHATEIGTIQEVFDTSSRVQLYSSAGTRTTIEINDAGALYVAEGRGGGEVDARIPRHVDIKEGDLLTAPAFDSRVIAEIKDISVSETDPFISARGQMPVNIFELTWVLIETTQ